MGPFKIKVDDSNNSKIQESLFELGCEWFGSTNEVKPLANCWVDVGSNGRLTWSFHGSDEKELTLPQLRDLVAQSKSEEREYLDPNDNYKLCLINPSDAAHWMIEVPEGADFYMEMLTGLKVGSKFFFKFDEEDLRVLSGSGWQHASYDSIQEYVDEGDQLLWSRETVKKDQGLISGAEAMIAALDDKEVEYYRWADRSCNWRPFNDEDWSVEDLKSGTYSFRLKPTTLTVNAEPPKPHKETQHNALVFAVTYEFKSREERNAFADKLRGNNS